MTKRNEILMWQMIAVGVAVVAVYKYQQHLKSGGSTINGMNLNLNPEKVVDIASKFVPPEWRSQAQELGKTFLGRMFQ